MASINIVILFLFNLALYSKASKKSSKVYFEGIPNSFNKLLELQTEFKKEFSTKNLCKLFS